MAQINDPNVTAQIASLANTGVVDTDQIVALLNTALPAGQQIAVGAGVTTGIYKRFGEFDKVNAKVEVVTTGLWTSDEGQINNFFTSSTQAAATSGKYYYNIYSYNPQISASAEVEFAIAYGHVDSSGSATLDVDTNSTLATKATYAQYKSILLDPTDSKFSFPNSGGTEDDSNGLYVINIARNRYRESMDAGNWELNLSGSNGNFTFIDDSGKKFGDNFGKAGRVFNIVEGVLNVGTQLEATITNQYDSNGKGFGLFYPDRGIMVFNPTALQTKLGNIHDENGNLIGGMSGSHATGSEQYNHKRLYYAVKKGADFDARRTENVSTQHFFVRATNREFNYSNNPTYIDTNGDFTEATFETDPQTYITTVGLYNDSNELVAVAKTSQPIVKSFDKEVLIKVKLSF
jgi:hypothetical protein